VPVAGQFSLFGTEAVAPAPADLEGLLAGPGQVVRIGGTARVSVVVMDAWRASALRAEFAARGLTGTQVTTVDEHIGVRTAYSAVLAPLAARWLRGAVKAVPKGFLLEGWRLRLWAIAAGAKDSGYVLRLAPHDEGTWEPVGAALAASGLAATLLSARAGGPAYRITGRRRLARLRELVGPPPPGTPPGTWV